MSCEAMPPMSGSDSSVSSPPASMPNLSATDGRKLSDSAISLPPEIRGTPDRLTGSGSRSSDSNRDADPPAPSFPPLFSRRIRRDRAFVPLKLFANANHSQTVFFIHFCLETCAIVHLSGIFAENLPDFREILFFQLYFSVESRVKCRNEAPLRSIRFRTLIIFDTISRNESRGFCDG